MRVITSVQGSVAIKFSPDDVVPNDTGILARDLVSFIGESYKFSLKPEVPPGLLVNPIFVFQTGEFISENNKYPINQLTAIQGGLILTAKDTDIADIILADMMTAVEKEFTLRVSSNIREKYYVSTLVLEFEPALEKQISVFNRVLDVINRELGRGDEPFGLKRLAFGVGDIQQAIGGTFAIEDLANTDFGIERRAGEPYPVNRYFSISPTSTKEHARILVLVEEAMRDQADEVRTPAASA